jgi:hypothetical protein
MRCRGGDVFASTIKPPYGFSVAFKAVMFSPSRQFCPFKKAAPLIGFLPGGCSFVI